MLGRLLLLLVAQCSIAPYDRIYNASGSQCVWASLETIGRHWGMSVLYDLTEKHKGTSGPGEVASVLRSRGVQFHQGQRDFATLKQAIVNHYPVAVGLNGTHMLLVVDVTPDTVSIIDNSDRQRRVQVWPLHTFQSRWDGWFVVIAPAPGSWHTVLWRTE